MTQVLLEAAVHCYDSAHDDQLWFYREIFGEASLVTISSAELWHGEGAVGIVLFQQQKLSRLFGAHLGAILDEGPRILFY